ncbi:site-specific integrase [Streptomyces gossypiisoli]|uniref:site-specific integrase n=1 Tax=Streptomyces gossypiisoli TaxID=2748864 RepID=UPI0015DA5042|nr:site-specific integrase [Streptomyces gossypiisoli]
MSSGRDGWSEAPCRRCAWTVPVTRAGVCAPCLLAVRLGEDDAWAWGELHDEALAPGRPRQLALDIDGVVLPEARPLRMPQAKPGRRASIPSWLRARLPERVHDDPRICPPQVPGQLGLFPTPARQFARVHAARIGDRKIPGLEAVSVQLQQMADDRRVRARTMWIWRLEGFARLALAARDPDQHQVAAAALKDLLYNGPVLGQALDRAGLLAPPPPRRVVPPRGTGPTRQGGQRDPELRGQCMHCLAWANDRRVLCVPCTSWCHEVRKRGGKEAECDRCHRTLMLSGGMCRMCRIVVAETEVDTAQIAMKDGDQLWFARPHAAGLAVGRLQRSTAALQGRFALKRRRARARAKSARRLSEHLLDPAQLELFPAPPRDWTRLDTSTPPALTAAADGLVTDFTAYMRGRGWNADFFRGSIRTLRIVTGHLGADVPFQESDIRALASMRADLQGARVINYLRLRGLLAPQPSSDPCIARARNHATAISDPTFSAAVHTFIDVLLGQGSTSSRARKPKTVENYATAILDTLEAWIADGLTDPREITKKHIEDALDPLRGDQARRLHTALRSFFRALKRERLVFRDPARSISLTTSRHVPTALPSDRIAGLLDRLDDPRDRLMVALVAIYALLPGQLTQLQRTDLDRSKGRLRLRRTGRIDHVIYLDAFTLGLATAWELQRHRRWPDSSNPHLFVTRNTAVDDSGPSISAGVVQQLFQRVGLPAGRLRVDRIVTRHATAPTPSG